MNLRKIISRRACILVLLLATAVFGASAQAAPEPVDPIVGNWLWNRGQAVTISADGTAHSRGVEGAWQYLHNPEVQRHYRIVWEHGQYVDELSCSEDGLRAHVRDKDGKQFDVRRAMDNPPAAAPALAASHMSSLAVATPKPLTPAATAQPTVAADLGDPIVGGWQWGNDRATFAPDGTITTAKGGQGTWKFLHNPEADRQYRVEWSGGKYSVDLTYDRTARVGHAINNRGKKFDVTPLGAASRETATPGKPSESYFGAPGR